MAVNGIEIEVGQKWKTRGGEVRTIIFYDEHDTSYPWETEADWLTDTGCSRLDEREHSYDLVELIEYADGFKPWAGGEQPAETVGKEVTLRLSISGNTKGPADRFYWGADATNRVLAYKVVEEVEFSGDEPADADALASETLQALGYRFDGQCWVQDESTPIKSALDVQEGGNHYKTLGIQPVEYIQANSLDYFQGNIVKYVTRHKSKNGAEDLKKAIHYCQLALEMQYGKAV